MPTPTPTPTPSPTPTPTPTPSKGTTVAPILHLLVGGRRARGGRGRRWRVAGRQDGFGRVFRVEVAGEAGGPDQGAQRLGLGLACEPRAGYSLERAATRRLPYLHSGGQLASVGTRAIINGNGRVHTYRRRVTHPDRFPYLRTSLAGHLRCSSPLTYTPSNRAVSSVVVGGGRRSVRTGYTVVS